MVSQGDLTPGKGRLWFLFWNQGDLESSAGETAVQTEGKAEPSHQAVFSLKQRQVLALQTASPGACPKDMLTFFFFKGSSAQAAPEQLIPLPQLLIC